jgi:hypothetical protein
VAAASPAAAALGFDAAGVASCRLQPPANSTAIAAATTMRAHDVSLFAVR